jgi:dTDP-4-amino-4,6-dideoxygalactose transaminase
MITTGGGGMLVTDDAELARHARHLTTQARLPGRAYTHDEVGYNYRLSNVAAALGVAQLEQLRQFLDAKREIAARYDEGLGVDSSIALAPRAPWADPTFWLYSIRLRNAGLADRVLEHLADLRIEARPVWTPLHLLKPYRGAPTLGDGSAAIAVASTAVSLPSSVHLDANDQSRVIGAVLHATSTS